MKQKMKATVELHKKGFRLLRIIHEIDRNMLPRTILESIINAFIPYISLVLSAEIIDYLFKKEYKNAILTVLIMCTATFVAQLVVAILQYYNGICRNNLPTELQGRIREKAMELDYATMDNPEIVSMIHNTEKAAQYNGGMNWVIFRYRALLQYSLSAITAVGLTVQLCFALPRYGGGVAKAFANPFITMIVLLLTWLIGKKFTKQQSEVVNQLENEIAEEHYKAESGLSYWSYEVLFNVAYGQLLRVGGLADMVLANTEKYINATLPVWEKMGISTRKSRIAEGTETGLFSVAAYFVVLVKVLTEAITIGSFTKYSGALLQLNEAITKIIWSEAELKRLVDNLIKLADFLELENKMETGSIHIEKRLDHCYEIEFKDVGFCYPGSDEFVLRHVNTKITLKNKLAVVGKNGAGKSTFIKLLCRLYDPTEGVITLNSVDIRKYNYKEYLSLFGVVFQDFHLFNYSIAQNVAASNEYDEEKVIKCLEQAGIFDFIKELPKGIETVIEKAEEDSVNLSGGQAQKVSIGRALYKDAPFVILDEPTAALDPISEAEIYERFDEMVEDKTSVYISHRMSSCRFCDEILVFDKGQICERGTHEELVAKKGLYESLWMAQAQYYA